MSKVPLWELTRGYIEYNDSFWYGSWYDFIVDEPWNANCLSGAIPAFWKVYHPDDPEFDDEFDYPELGLVYLETAPLRAHSVRVSLDPNDDLSDVEKWLYQHGFLSLGG